MHTVCKKKVVAMAIARDTQQMELVSNDCRIKVVLWSKNHLTSKIIGVLQRLTNLILTNAKLWIYIKLQFYLTCCSLVWHFCRASDRNKLERINERGLRTVFKDWVFPSSNQSMNKLYFAVIYRVALKC